MRKQIKKDAKTKNSTKMTYQMIGTDRNKCSGGRNKNKKAINHVRRKNLHCKKINVRRQ